MGEDFAFNGVHCNAHNVAFIAERWPAAPPPIINKTAISGRHGTIRYPGTYRQERTLTGMLYLLSNNDEVISYYEMMARTARIAEWLCPGGRKQLILDAVPDRFYMAEVEEELVAETSEWGNGHILLTFSLQPFAYALHASLINTTLEAGTEKTISITMPGNQPAPLEITITASAPLTWAQFIVGGSLLRLEGMALAAGQSVEVRYDLSIGEVMSIAAAGESGMRYLAPQSAAPFELHPGGNSIIASAGADCAVSVQARGRWL